MTEHAASVPGAAIIVGGFETGDALIYCAVLGAVVSLLIRRYCRVLVPVCLVVLPVPLFQAGGVFDEGSRGRLTFAMLDVGQGDALLIETPEGKNILIDAGPASYAFDSGERNER